MKARAAATVLTSEKAQRQIERELAMIEKLKLRRLFSDRLGHRRVLPRKTAFWCRAAARRPTAPSVIRWASRPSIPVGMELLFERFLSEERGEWPDIDLDLPSGDKRERVIQYVYERYGKLGAAMTANVITYRGRIRRARSRQGAGLRCRDARPALEPGALLGVAKIPKTRPTASSAMPASISPIRASANFSSCIWRCRICRGIWASTPAAW